MSSEEPSSEDLSFEEALGQLETMVQTLERGEVPLSELVEKFEKGSHLLKHCQAKLKEAELKIEKLDLKTESATEFREDAVEG